MYTLENEDVTHLQSRYNKSAYNKIIYFWQADAWNIYNEMTSNCTYKI